MKSSLENFGIYLLSERGLSLNTLEAYNRDISYFCDYLISHEIPSWKEVNQNHIYSFLLTRKELDYADSSLYRWFMSLKVFFRFLKREKIILKDITQFLETPKIWKLIPEILSEEEINTLLRQIDSSKILGARDKAIIEILYGSGLRVSELCDLKIYDVDDISLKVRGKGGKERIVPIGQQAIHALDQYLNFRHSSQREEWLFLSQNGKQIDRTQVWKMVKKYAKEAGIEKKISPHTFRHTFATHLLDNGADLRIIQDLLGHATISSTDRYTQVSQSHIKNAFNAFHPRNLL